MLFGYSIHLLTDMYWIKQIYSGFKIKCENDSSPVQDERMVYYNDTDALDKITTAGLTVEIAVKVDAPRIKVNLADMEKPGICIR